MSAATTTTPTLSMDERHCVTITIDGNRYFLASASGEFEAAPGRALRNLYWSGQPQLVRDALASVVRAVNNHDGLVAALEEVVEATKGQSPDPWRVSAAFAKAREVLAATRST